MKRETEMLDKLPRAGAIAVNTPILLAYAAVMLALAATAALVRRRLL